MTIIAPYGSWRSCITTDLLTSQAVRLSEPCFDGEDIYWIESRPWEKGRSVIVKKTPHQAPVDVLPRPLNARSQVHEYGGGSYCVYDGVLFFVLYDDQRIYRLDTQASTLIPEPLTPEGHYRYADLWLDHVHHRLICICEEHNDGQPQQEPKNTIIAVPLDASGAITTLASGEDFYSNPRISPDGRYLSWVSWNHPDMPWDSSQCWVAKLNGSGNPDTPLCVAGGKEESVFQPQWSPDGHLFLVSDRSGWWNIYQCDLQAIHHQSDPSAVPTLRAITSLKAEFATPQWVFGMSTYGFIDEQTLMACFADKGCWFLAKINIPSAALSVIETSLTDISGLCCRPAYHQDRTVKRQSTPTASVVLLGGGPTQFEALWQLDIDKHQITEESPRLIKAAIESTLSENTIAKPRPVCFPTGTDSSKTEGEAHGFFYAPTNPHYRAPADEKPPLIVFCHGGPTGATTSALSLKIQYWTSRGFAILDVNYRGSTGYGRQYKDQLKGKWGLADVDDVCAGAQYVANKGWVDPQRQAIKGGSAGGYTALAALAFRQQFNAGASHYGVGDLESLVNDTHKFESHYLDQLIGPYPADLQAYQERSPLHYCDELNCPVIFFQGMKDKVVPPEQAEAMVKALSAKGLPVAHITFEEEGHGFRQAESIKAVLENELYFYSQVFKFTPADNLLPINIANHEPTT